MFGPSSRKADGHCYRITLKVRLIPVSAVPGAQLMAARRRVAAQSKIASAHSS